MAWVWVRVGEIAWVCSITILLIFWVDILCWCFLYICLKCSIVDAGSASLFLAWIFFSPESVQNKCELGGNCRSGQAGQSARQPLNATLPFWRRYFIVDSTQHITTKSFVQFSFIRYPSKWNGTERNAALYSSVNE